MTKREICERLIDLRDQLETGWQRNDVPARELCRDAVYDLRSLLLDLAAQEDKEPPKRAIGKKEDVPRREWLDYDFVGPVCEHCGVRTYRVRGEDVFACPICFMHRGAFVAPKAEEPKAEEKSEKEPPLIKLDGNGRCGWCTKCGGPVFKKYGSGENFCPS